MKLQSIFIACVLYAAGAGAQVSPASSPTASTAPSAAQLREVEHARINAERAEVQKRTAVAEAACYQNFVVTSCLAAARAERRKVLSDLKRQEVALNDAERRERAEREVQSLQERTAAQEQKLQEAQANPRPMPVPKLPRSAASAAADAARAQEAAAGRAAANASKQSEHASRVAAEAANEKQYQEKLLAAEKRRKGREEKASKVTKPAAQPLPEPGR